MQVQEARNQQWQRQSDHQEVISNPSIHTSDLRSLRAVEEFHVAARVLCQLHDAISNFNGEIVRSCPMSFTIAARSVRATESAMRQRVFARNAKPIRASWPLAAEKGAMDIHTLYSYAHDEEEEDPLTEGMPRTDATNEQAYETSLFEVQARYWACTFPGLFQGMPQKSPGSVDRFDTKIPASLERATA
ncbi:hypothetical protein CTAM01_01265 [Colletotrichum tamarilloi]|uniref:Uncharacterized protein n=1 Tax=Colletotrichum tamarilloi TaxID=1209934 RepID=A0ABQ9RQN4_9PEZI|nr:uncharacterized protein CTAM01_01265 [Colletotrichum tamarilloi]KAK1510692.1 hypothetical protein CTAM01_01265 [Colletotrichum tamarilloi]